jgi:hypothetical protein
MSTASLEVSLFFGAVLDMFEGGLEAWVRALISIRAVLRSFKAWLPAAVSSAGEPKRCCYVRSSFIKDMPEGMKTICLWGCRMRKILISGAAAADGLLRYSSAMFRMVCDLWANRVWLTENRFA